MTSGPWERESQGSCRDGSCREHGPGKGGRTPQGDLEARLDRARGGSKTKARRSQGQVSGGWGASEEGGGDLDPRMRVTFQGSPRTGPRLSALP